MTFDSSVSNGYDKLRKRRLGIPKEMELVDKTELPGKSVSRKRKTYRKDKDTLEKVKQKERGLK